MLNLYRLFPAEWVQTTSLPSFLLSFSPFLSILPSFRPQSLPPFFLLFLPWWTLCRPGWLRFWVLFQACANALTRLGISLLWGLKAVAEQSQACQEPETFFSPPPASSLVLRSESQRAPEGWEWKRGQAGQKQDDRPRPGM